MPLELFTIFYNYTKLRLANPKIQLMFSNFTLRTADEKYFLSQGQILKQRPKYPRGYFPTVQSVARAKKTEEKKTRKAEKMQKMHFLNAFLCIVCLYMCEGRFQGVSVQPLALPHF